MSADHDELRHAIRQRLEHELDDAEMAASITAALADDVVAGLGARCDGDVARSPVLSYQPPFMPVGEVESLWILAFGYRRTGVAPEDAAIPPMHTLEPGPVNEALAGLAAAFVDRHPVPIVAQWEVARGLAALGIDDVISVEPDHADDGSVIYLSTAGVIEKGQRLLTDAGGRAGRAGILGHADHAARCVATARAAGLDAAVPGDVQLPGVYDPESGQPWTRSRIAYVPVDLMARSVSG